MPNSMLAWGGLVNDLESVKEGTCALTTEKNFQYSELYGCVLILKYA